MFGSTFETPVDGQHRIAIPNTLRDRVSIVDRAVIVGTNNCFEIWNPELWNAEKNRCRAAILAKI